MRFSKNKEKIMSRQDEILGLHPSKHPVIGTWLDYEDKEPTETSCVRILSEKDACDEAVIEPFAKCLIDFHYSPASIKALKKRFEQLGLPEFASYYAQSRKLPQNSKTQKGNAVEVLMTEYSLAAINKPDLTFAHRFRYNPNVDQSMKGDDMLIVDFSDEKNSVIYLGEAKFRKTVDTTVLKDIQKALAKDKMPLSLTFLRDQYEKLNDEIYEKLDNVLLQKLSEYDIRYVGFIVGDKNAADKVEEKWVCNNPKHIMLVLPLDNPEDFIAQVYDKATSLLTETTEKL